MPMRQQRSPELVERLERSRERRRARRAAEREREQIVTDAVRRYLENWEAVGACERKRDAETADLRSRIEAIEARAARRIAELRMAQGAAALLIREQGQSDDDIADLLELTVKQVRQLIGFVRAGAEESAGNTGEAANSSITGSSPGRAADGGSPRQINVGPAIGDRTDD